MEEKQTIEDVFAGILADYFVTCKVEPFPVNIRIVEDMWQGYLEIRPDHAEKSSKDMEEFQKTIMELLYHLRTMKKLLPFYCIKSM